MSENSETAAHEFTYTDPEYWTERWAKMDISFHKDVIHHMLEKYLSKLTGNESSVKIFFPLCGKAIDIAWLASLGHEVIGVELVQEAIEQFFQEHNIKFTKSRVGELDLFKSEDGKIRLYSGDIFNFTQEHEGLIENVWDRGSLVALPEDLRQKYSVHIQSLLAPNFRYLLDTFVYDTTKYKGPPHYVSLEEIKRLYSGKCQIELVESAPVAKPFNNLEQVIECVYSLRPL